ncbi:MAG: AraC family transcriptional regulator ligand-binding domain-containing protein [Zhongshania sp.]|uniref:AraC family transcriptional regulator n=1 Tax=Zhongshania sp. TaxID=1971902 RepID=UPI00260BC49D|nr:AraC family transcriptional regulator [Zhongshania sp.]MDF1691386.1 AraC family transcriptional regulator ligand-binding domain-containing protein [Zhongshania sp.]
MHATEQDPPLELQAEFNYRMAVSRLLAGAINHGLDTNALLCDAGMNPAAIEGDGDVSRSQYINLLTSLLPPLQDEFFGLREHPVKPGVTSMMVEIALGNDTLGAAMTQSLRFMRLVCDDMRMSLSDEGDDIALVLAGLDSQRDPGHFLVDYWLNYLHRVFSWMIDQLIPVKAVELAFSENVNPERLVYQLRGDWQSGCKRNAVVFSRKYLSLPILRSRNEWLALRQTAIQSGVVHWPDEQVQVSSKVRSLVFNALRQGEAIPSLNTVAQHLHLTTATLHRHLNSEGTSFQRILNDVRCDTAIDKLRFQKMSVAEVAEQLGFAEPRSFSRAFKQWTGASPSDYQS